MKIQNLNNAVQRLRGFAVLIVILEHLKVSYPDHWPQWLGSAHGVDLFFVISGFVITKTSLEYGRNQSGIVFLKHFYRRRFWRIFPLAVLAMGVYYAFSVILPSPILFGRPEQVGEEVVSVLWLKHNVDLALGYFSNPRIGFFWSITIEEKFYLFFPIIFSLMKDKMKLGAALFGIWLVNSMVVNAYMLGLFPRESYPQFPLFFDSFKVGFLIWGCLIGLAEAKLSSWAHQPHVKWLSWVLGAFILAFPPLSVALNLDATFSAPILWVSVLLVALSSSDPQRAFSGGKWVNRALEHLGDRSYSYYLWHVLVIYLCSHFFWGVVQGFGFWYFICLYALILWALSEASYRWYENPVRQWGIRGGVGAKKRN